MADLATELKQWLATQLPPPDGAQITPVVHLGTMDRVVDTIQAVEDGVVDVADKVSTLKDRVDVLAGLPRFTDSQRAGLQYITDQTGGAQGLVLAVAANTDKVSFDAESRATLARLAGETERSEEDVLALIASAPIPTAVAAEFLSVHGDIDDINGRIDNLPVSETIPQSVLDKIQALEDRLEFTPAEQMKIMANADGVATNAQSILDLIQSQADANALIEDNTNARRITVAEIQDIVDLKAQIADLEDNLELTQEQSDKINASDAVHSALSRRIKTLEDAPDVITEWNATATYNTGDLVITDRGLFKAKTDNIVSAIFEPAVGSSWVAAWDLIADAQVAGGASESELKDIADNKEALFGEEIDVVGRWDENKAYVAGNKQFNALAIGDVVNTRLADGTEVYNEVANVNFTSAGNTSAPDTPDNQADQDNRWTRKEYMQGLVDITLDEAAVDQRVINQLNPTLITQDAVSAPDVDGGSFTINSGDNFRATDTITITDANANPLFKDVITFDYALRQTAGNGGFEPAMEFQVVQNGEVLLDRTLANPSDRTTASFRGHLNQPFDVITQGTYRGDGLSRTFNRDLTLIAGARKGPIYDAMIAAIDNETAADFQFIRGEIAKLQALTSGVDTALAGVSEAIQSNTDGIDEVRTFGHATRAAIDTDVMQAVRGGSIVPTDTPVINPTELNTTLGGGSANFAEQIKDGAIGDATQFLMRITDPSQVLDYGAGRVLDVFNGHVRGFILRPAADEQTDTETLYITTADGRGTPDSLAVLEFGVGDAPREPNEAELFFTRDIPDANLPAGQSISNVSFAFAVRTNNNWQSISETIQLDLRSGEERSFAIPHVVGITFTATALADGRIKTVATHNAGGDPAQQVSNGGAIRFDVGYVKTTITPAVERGQTTVDLGVFTGNNLVGFDAIQTGDNAEATAHYTTPTGRFDTGYYLLDVHRLSFATDNAGFANAKGESSMLISGADTALTPEIMGQLDGADAFLGLFVNATRHLDVLDLGRVVMGRNLKNEPVVYGVEGEGVVAATPTISAFYVNAIISATEGDTGSGNQILSTTIGDVNMRTPILNQGGDMNNAGVYTAPETGVYWMSFTLATSVGSSTNFKVRAGLSIDGAEPTEQQDAGIYQNSGMRDLPIAWAGAVLLTKGQTVKLQALSQNASPVIPNETYFTGYLIGKTG